MEGIGRDELLGADVALSSKKLLNVAARGIENGGEVCGGHLDWTFSMRFTGRKSVKERRGLEEWEVFVDEVAAVWRSSAILAHKINFVECPARVVL